MEFEIKIYKTSSGKSPFSDWFDKISEFHTRAKILTRLDRLRLGNFGDCKPVEIVFMNLGCIMGLG